MRTWASVSSTKRVPLQTKSPSFVGDWDLAIKFSIGKNAAKRNIRACISKARLMPLRIMHT